MTRDLVAVLGAVLAAGWAALLALAEGALAADPGATARVLPAAYADRPDRLRRALALSRVMFLGLAAVALSSALRWWSIALPGVVVVPLLLTAVLVLAADMVPRTLGLWKPTRIGGPALRVTAASLGLLAPLVVGAGIVDRALGRLFGVTARPAGQDMTQRDMLLGVFALADTMVHEVMTPRVDVVGVDVSASFADVLARATAAEHARLPVFDDDLDHIIGVLHLKDLIPARLADGAPDEWRTLVRPVEIVPEVKRLDQQLRDFQHGTAHLAVVVDEFGGTAGIVTLEDVLEEIVGEIGDEYDAQEADPITAVGASAWSVDGRANLADVAVALGARFTHEAVTTAGGYFVAALGHVPAPGEQVEVEGWRVTAERVEKRRVARLRFERLASASGEPA